MVSAMRLNGTLYPQEEVLVATRSHEVFLLPALLFGFAAVVAWSFASAVYPASAVFGLLGYALAIWCTFLSLKRLWRWTSTGFFVTSQRLVIQRATSGRTVSIPLQGIEGIDARHTAWRAGGAATLSVHAQGGIHVLRQIPRGAQFSLEVQQAQQRLLQQNRGGWWHRLNPFSS